MFFLGQTERSIDEKSRIALPMEMREGFISGVVYATPGPDGAIWLFPEEAFADATQSLKQSLLQDEDLMEFLDIFYAHSKRLELDRQGRIRLPEMLMRYANLVSEAFVNGAGELVKVRNVAGWAEKCDENLPRLQELTKTLFSKGYGSGSLKE